MPRTSKRILPADLCSAIDGALPVAQTLFEEVRTDTADILGVSREPYGAGEQAAIDAVTRVARELGLEIVADPFGNVYYTLRGEDRDVPGWLVGSHVDSVPNGGNYDGLAGVVAGIA